MILETKDLTKDYGSLRAVNNLNLSMEKGQVFGMLGPNGSGKTTTLGMILGVTNQTSGSYRWFGKPGDHRARKRIGAILEMPVFYPYMTAVQNLEISCIIKEVDYGKIEPALELVGLSDRKNDTFKSYSLGMKQRLAIASAFLTDPEVMILDEPTNGLDPMGIADIRALIRRIADLGKTILIASHLLDEVQKVCTHFCVLQTGNLIYQGSVKEDFADKSIITLSAADMDDLGRKVELLNSVRSVERDGEYLVVECDPGVDTAGFNKNLVEQGVFLSHLSFKHRSLEEQFIKILEENNEKTA